MTNSSDKDTASFFKNGTTEQFDYCFKLYPQVLKLKAEKRSKKPQELIRLDQWYQNELPKLIKARGKDAHIVYDELVQTMKWKQTRGKFYPQLSYLVKVNTPRAVMQETKKAFRKLPNLEQAITALSNLKGVGTTMASALLAAACPDSAPFMADECLMAIPEIEGIDYTTKEYLNFVQHIQSTVERLNTEVGGGVGEKPLWSPHRVELALWAHYVANDLSPELLEKMPCGSSDGVNPIKANGTMAAVHDDTNDDTNDDDNTLGTHPAANNNVRETENENTNPTVQDGDSSFVSNDSSQEPIIDENTTQTTVTTTTEDGDADGDADTLGTPLAFDSESNIESPLKNTIQTNKTTIYPTMEMAVVNSSSSTVAANGNGALLPPSASEDGESSNCLRPESEYEDESSNSNGNALTANPLPDSSIRMNLHNDISATNTDNDSTLSSAGGNSAAAAISANTMASSPIATTTITVGQKRALNCSDEVALEDANINNSDSNTNSDTTTTISSTTTTITTTNSEPDAKKVRNE